MKTCGGSELGEIIKRHYSLSFDVETFREWNHSEKGELISYETHFERDGKKDVIVEKLINGLTEKVYLNGEEVAGQGNKSPYCVAEEKMVETWRQ